LRWHPVETESVVNIVGRWRRAGRAVDAHRFLVLSARHSDPRGGLGGLAHRGSAWPPFLAMFSKESGIMLITLLPPL